jgi:hypothetical protein
MAPVLLFLQYFGLTLLLITIFHIVGQLLFPVRKEKPHFQLFIGFMATLVLCSTFFAIWKTHGLTIQLLFLPWLYLLIREQRKVSLSSPPLLSIPSNIPWLLLSVLGIFIWNFLGRINTGAFPFVLPEGTALAPNDIHIYGLRAYYLAQSGWENYFGVYNTFESNFHGVNPYHYLELWLTGGITSIFGGLNILNLSLVTNSLFHYCCLLGILAIIEVFDTIKRWHIIAAILGLFTGGLYLFYSKIGFPAFSLSMMTYRFKMIAYYPFVLGAIIAILQQNNTRAALFLLALPIATFTTLPTVLGTVIILLFFLLWQKHRMEAWRILLYSLVLLGGFGLFYILSPSPDTNSTFAVENQELSSRILDLLSWKKLSMTLGRFLYALSHWLILYWPVLLLFTFRKNYRNWLIPLSILTGGILLSGAVAYALLADFAQATQLFYNLAIAFSNCLMILLFVLCYTERSKLNPLFSGLMLGLFALTISTQIFLLAQRHLKPRGEKTYSNNYLQEIQSLVKNDELSQIGAAIKAGEDYQSDFSKMTAGYVLGYYLQYMEDGYTTVSLSDFDIPINPKNERNNLKDIQSGIFYQFVEKQKKANRFFSVEKSQTDFLSYYNINFLILSKQARLTPSLEKRAQRSITDPISGERFIILKQ